MTPENTLQHLWWFEWDAHIWGHLIAWPKCIGIVLGGLGGMALLEEVHYLVWL